jgi:hypothetical protein
LSTIDDADLDEVLRIAYPQGHAVLRCENGVVLLNHGARQLIGSPHLALEVLGPQGAGKLGRALATLGQRYVAQAERLLELAEESGGDQASTPARVCSRSDLQPTNTDSIKVGGGDA